MFPPLGVTDEFRPCDFLHKSRSDDIMVYPGIAESCDTPAEIVVTEETIDMVVAELREHHYHGDARRPVESVLRAMAYANPSASATILSK
jgi:hypothetical protein